MLHFATFCHKVSWLSFYQTFYANICHQNANVKFMPLFAAVCLSHILQIFATLRQYKICSTFCCSLTVLHFANLCHLKATVSAQPANQGSGMISSIMAACTVYFKVSGVQILGDCFRFPFSESLNSNVYCISVLHRRRDV